MASEIQVQTISGPPTGANANKVIIPAGQTLDINTWSPPAGTILQVVEDTVTAPYTISPGTTFTNYPNLAATITPSSTNSRIYVSAYCTWAANSDNQDVIIRMARNGSGVFIGDARNSNTRATYGQGDALAKVHYGWASVLFSTAFVDSPNSTSPLTYSIQFATGFAQGDAIDLGQQGVDAGATSAEQNTAPATIVLMEIAG